MDPMKFNLQNFWKFLEKLKMESMLIQMKQKNIIYLQKYSVKKQKKNYKMMFVIKLQYQS